MRKIAFLITALFLLHSCTKKPIVVEELVPIKVTESLKQNKYQEVRIVRKDDNLYLFSPKGIYLCTVKNNESEKKATMFIIGVIAGMIIVSAVSNND